MGSGFREGIFTCARIAMFDPLAPLHPTGQVDTPLKDH
jgi:hypothetical protein